MPLAFTVFFGMDYLRDPAALLVMMVSLSLVASTLGLLPAFLFSLAWAAGLFSVAVWRFRLSERLPQSRGVARPARVARPWPRGSAASGGIHRKLVLSRPGCASQVLLSFMGSNGFMIS
jgi:hypothetical protein